MDNHQITEFINSSLKINFIEEMVKFYGESYIKELLEGIFYEKKTSTEILFKIMFEENIFPEYFWYVNNLNTPTIDKMVKPFILNNKTYNKELLNIIFVEEVKKNVPVGVLVKYMYDIGIYPENIKIDQNELLEIKIAFIEQNNRINCPYCPNNSNCFMSKSLNYTHFNLTSCMKIFIACIKLKNDD